MDISDILLEISNSYNGQTLSSYDDSYRDAVRLDEQTDYHELTRTWVNEKSTDHLLSWPKDGLIARCAERIKDRIELVERMTGDMEPKTNFSLIIIQTELERWKYLMRSYLRARLDKIHKHPLYYLSSPALQSCLSAGELTFANQHKQLLHQHYLNSFLASFPVNLQQLDDSAGGSNMVEGPDEEGSVFVRGLGSRRGEGEVVYVRAMGKTKDGEIGVERGEVILAKWSDVRELIEKREMELV